MIRRKLIGLFKILTLMTVSMNVNCQVQTNFDLSFSYPLCISSDVNSYLLNSLDLKRNGISGLYFEMTVNSKKNWFFSTSGIYGESMYKNDSLNISLGQNFGFIGFGKELKLNEKFSTGISLHLGLMKSKQVIIKNGVTEEDIWDKYNSDKFEQLTQMSPIKIASQVDFFFNYHIDENITITTGFRNSISPMNKLDYVNGIQLYKNYFMPFLGARLLVFKSRKKETQIE
jgi:hypothetical protein